VGNGLVVFANFIYFIFANFIFAFFFRYTSELSGMNFMASWVGDLVFFQLLNLN